MKIDDNFNPHAHIPLSKMHWRCVFKAFLRSHKIDFGPFFQRSPSSLLESLYTITQPMCSCQRVWLALHFVCMVSVSLLYCVCIKQQIYTIRCIHNATQPKQQQNKATKLHRSDFVCAMGKNVHNREKKKILLPISKRRKKQINERGNSQKKKKLGNCKFFVMRRSNYFVLSTMPLSLCLFFYCRKLIGFLS